MVNVIQHCIAFPERGVSLSWKVLPLVNEMLAIKSYEAVDID